MEVGCLDAVRALLGEGSGVFAWCLLAPLVEFGEEAHYVVEGGFLGVWAGEVRSDIIVNRLKKLKVLNDEQYFRSDAVDLEVVQGCCHLSDVSIFIT